MGQIPAAGWSTGPFELAFYLGGSCRVCFILYFPEFPPGKMVLRDVCGKENVVHVRRVMTRKQLDALLGSYILLSLDSENSLLLTQKGWSHLFSF